MLAEYRVLRVVTKGMVPFILLYSLYVLLHGDYGPGGGFQAGVIFAAGIVLYGLVFGLQSAERALPMNVLLAGIPAGLLLYAGVGVVGLLRGGSFLDYNTLDPDDHHEGQHLGILLVEVGVGITVASVMVAVFYAFVHRSHSRGKEPR